MIHMSFTKSSWSSSRLGTSTNRASGRWSAAFISNFTKTCLFCLQFSFHSHRKERWTKSVGRESGPIENQLAVMFNYYLFQMKTFIRIITNILITLVYKYLFIFSIIFHNIFLIFVLEQQRAVILFWLSTICLYYETQPDWSDWIMCYYNSHLLLLARDL